MTDSNPLCVPHSKDANKPKTTWQDVLNLYHEIDRRISALEAQR